MNAGAYTVSQVAGIAHVTVRTLHHYDEIGLLQPSGRAENGYRLYHDTDLERLHEILLLRSLGFSLEGIAQVLTDPAHDRLKVLRAQREMLEEQSRRTTAVIQAVDAAIAALEGGKPMSDNFKDFPKDLFDGFDPAQYEGEVQERWGESEAYRESMRRTKRYTKDDWARFKAENERWGEAIVRLMQSGAKPESREAMDLAEEHRLSIDRWFYPCDYEMHVGLGEMYLADPRFTATYEKMAPGLTAFVTAAIKANAARHQ
jgi:DNA-binding transcriptional MerR regulator